LKINIKKELNPEALCILSKEKYDSFIEEENNLEKDK